MVELAFFLLHRQEYRVIGKDLGEDGHSIQYKNAHFSKRPEQVIIQEYGTLQTQNDLYIPEKALASSPVFS
jgi:hypothetical protein